VDLIVLVVTTFMAATVNGALGSENLSKQKKPFHALFTTP